MAARTDWNHHIEAWQASGLSQAAYCRLHGLALSTFSARLSAHRASAVPGLSLAARRVLAVVAPVDMRTVADGLPLSCKPWG